MLLRLAGRGPRYAQITRALCARIQRGTLRPGARLPATRTLALDLGCSRNIVWLAYEQLMLEGFQIVRSRVRVCQSSATGVFQTAQVPVRHR